jgi:hypothetical protein
VIDAFSVASGLGINRHKTVILAAKDSNHKCFAPYNLLLQQSNWPLVKFSDSHKYLGILFGRNIQVQNIFEAPAEKARMRARLFGPTLSRMDTQKRIIVFNVFITPIFSYVQMFYMMPSCVLRDYRSTMRRAISPFNGTAWPYSQLCAPSSCVGFKQPLRDPWVHNMVMLLKNYNFNLITTEADLPWDLSGSLRGRSRRATNWDSPVFRTHAELQVMEFLGPDFLDWDGLSALPKLDAKTIKKIAIQSLIVNYNISRSRSFTANFGRDHANNLRFRCSKYGVSDTDTLVKHFTNLPKTVPAFLITHYIKLFNGALNFDGGRRRKFDPNGSMHNDKNPENPFPCYLCNGGSSTLLGDHQNHIFTSCPCVQSAWADTLLHPRGPNDTSWYRSFNELKTPLYLPVSPPADKQLGYNRLSLIMVFCWTVYKTISQIRMGRSAIGASERIVSTTMEFRNVWTLALPNRKRKR